MSGRLLVVLALLLASTSAAASTHEVSITTEDGLALAATLYLPSRPGPAVILLHMLTRTRADFHALGLRLADGGFVALAIDLRGHGASDRPADDPESASLLRMQRDVRAARAFLAGRREAVPGRVAIIGASIGANLAALHAAGDPTVRALVLLSAGIDYRGLRPEMALATYGGRPALLLASLEDNYAVLSARRLAKQGKGTREIRLLNGGGHGTTMLARLPDLGGLLVDWLRQSGV